MSANLGQSSGQEVELNITPIIDCFTVLITFLLASASFLSIGFFEASTPGTSVSDDQSAKDPDLEVMVRVRANSQVDVTFKGKRSGTSRYDLSDKEAVKRLETEMESLKKSNFTVFNILMSADDAVPYKMVADTMGTLQKSEIPVVVGEF